MVSIISYYSIILYYNIITLWDHRRVCGPSLPETLLYGAWLYMEMCGHLHDLVTLPWRKNYWYLLNRMLGVLQSSSGWSTDKNSSWPCWDTNLNSLVFQFSAQSLYWSCHPGSYANQVSKQLECSRSRDPSKKCVCTLHPHPSTVPSLFIPGREIMLLKTSNTSLHSENIIRWIHIGYGHRHLKFPMGKLLVTS